MTDDELAAFLLDDAADWPTVGFRLYAHVEIPQPAFWRERLRVFWEDARPETRQRILRDLRQLRAVLERPIHIAEGFVDNAGLASARAYREAEERRKANEVNQQSERRGNPANGV